MAKASVENASERRNAMGQDQVTDSFVCSVQIRAKEQPTLKVL